MAFTARDGKTQTVLAEINMVPFIDIVLVLLIIFMITAPVIQSGIEVDVPETESTNVLTDPLLVVTIDKNERIYLQNKQINVNELPKRVKEMLPAFKRQSVYVQGDKDVTLGAFTTVLDYLKSAGIKDIEIVTEPLEGSRR
jgi:biopolymer transport protein TolR